MFSRSFFFYLGFLSRTSTIHKTVGEGGGHLFNSALPLYPLHSHLDISLVITGDLHVAGLKLRTFGFPAQVANHYATRPHDHFNIAMPSLRCLPLLTSEIKTKMDVWETAYMTFHFRRNEYFQFSVFADVISLYTFWQKWNHKKGSICICNVKETLLALVLWHSNCNQKCLVPKKQIYPCFRLKLATKNNTFLDEDW